MVVSSGLETLLAQTEDSVMTLSNMLLSPHVAEFRQEVEHWVQRLQELGNAQLLHVKRKRFDSVRFHV